MVRAPNISGGTSSGCYMIVRSICPLFLIITIAVLDPSTDSVVVIICSISRLVIPVAAGERRISAVWVTKEGAAGSAKEEDKQLPYQISVIRVNI